MSEHERLSRELRNRAAETGGHPISFDDVKRSATKMKWQQRAAGIGAAAVVLAIAVPVGFAVTNTNGSRNDGNPPVATNTPNPTVASPKPTPVVLPDGSIELRLEGAPTGAEPSAGWIEGNVLHLGDGSEVQLPKAYDDAVPYKDGYLAANVADSTIDEIQDGKVVRTFPGAGFAMSPEGDSIAWFEQKAGGPGTLRIYLETAPDQDSDVEIPAGKVAVPVALSWNNAVYNLRDEATGEQSTWYTDPPRSHEIEGAFAVGGTTGSQAAVMTKLKEDGSCWAFYGFPGGEYAGSFGKETCDFSLGQVSSDGKYVIGWPAYADGWGPGNVAVLDAKTLKPVVRFTRSADYGVSHAVWDGDTNSLIASVYQEGVWQLVRLGLDGTIETASDQVQADDMSAPFRLASIR